VNDPTTAPQVVTIVNENSVFDLPGFVATFNLKKSSLRREIKMGRIKVYKRCGRYFLLGADVLLWLRGGQVKP
jgi:hypothetical protein